MRSDLGSSNSGNSSSAGGGSSTGGGGSNPGDGKFGNSNVNFPGAHPSSEGKRRRNRSNVEAMTAKHSQDQNEADSTSSNTKEDLNHNGRHFFILFLTAREKIYGPRNCVF